MFKGRNKFLTLSIFSYIIGFFTSGYYLNLGNIDYIGVWIPTWGTYLNIDSIIFSYYTMFIVIGTILSIPILSFAGNKNEESSIQGWCLFILSLSFWPFIIYKKELIWSSLFLSVSSILFYVYGCITIKR